MKKTTFNISLTRTKHPPLSFIFRRKARPPKRNSKKRWTLSTTKPCLQVCVILST